MNVAEHKEQEKKVHEAMRKNGHTHEVSYHHGLSERPMNALEAIEGMEDK